MQLTHNSPNWLNREKLMGISVNVKTQRGQNTAEY